MPLVGDGLPSVIVPPAEPMQKPLDVTEAQLLALIRNVAPSGTSPARTSCTCCTKTWAGTTGKMYGTEVGTSEISAPPPPASVTVPVPRAVCEVRLPNASAGSTWRVANWTWPTPVAIPDD